MLELQGLILAMAGRRSGVLRGIEFLTCAVTSFQPFFARFSAGAISDAQQSPSTGDRATTDSFENIGQSDDDLSLSWGAGWAGRGLGDDPGAGPGLEIEEGSELEEEFPVGMGASQATQSVRSDRGSASSQRAAEQGGPATGHPCSGTPD